MKNFSFDLIYIVLFVLILDRIKQKASGNLYLCWLLNVPGTLLHEISHFIVAMITNGKPSKLSILPSKIKISGKEYYQLGYISSNNIRWYNRFFIGFAPLLLWLPIYFLNEYFFIVFADNLLNNILFLYLIIVLVDSSIPSIVDFKQALSGGKLIFLLLFLMFIYLLLKVNDVF